MQIKTTMKYHLTPVKMVIIKKPTNNTCWRGCKEKGALLHRWGFPGGSVVKNLPDRQERRVQPLGWEDPLQKAMAMHSSFLPEKSHALADRILADIISSDMTDVEKAWAVYEWSTGSLKYSTRTSYLMGNYVEGAYSGFTIRSGNCYIYYAVTGVLLTRAGIENIMIQRDKPNDPHYWNLVKIDGSWYHLDTCPHIPGHQKQCFLWTDADLADYNKNEVADYYSFDASLYPASP